MLRYDKGDAVWRRRRPMPLFLQLGAERQLRNHVLSHQGDGDRGETSSVERHVDGLLRSVVIMGRRIAHPNLVCYKVFF